MSSSYSIVFWLSLYVNSFLRGLPIFPSKMLSFPFFKLNLCHCLIYVCNFSSDIIQRNWVFTTNWDVLATHCRWPLIFQTIISVRSNILNLKYQRITPLGCKDIKIRKFEFVAKTQFLFFKIRKNIKTAITRKLWNWKSTFRLKLWL